MVEKVSEDEVFAYIDSKRGSWAQSTLVSEEHRLMGLKPFLNGDPEFLMSHLQRLRPYSRLTAWTRVVAFWGETNRGENPYLLYRNKNKRLFKHAYTPKRVVGSYEDSWARIHTIPDVAVRDKAIELIRSAQRWSESKETNALSIQGKGGLLRPNFKHEPSSYNGSYSHFRCVLKKYTGLTPHDLRKLALTRLAEKGATPADLCLVAGWSSIKTAYVYLQPKRVEELKRLMHE